MRRARPMVTVALLAILYWTVASIVLAAREPWDAPRYPVAIAIALAGAAAYAAPARAAWWGPIVVLAQLPVMLARIGLGPLLAGGILVLLVECLPATAVGHVRRPGG